MEKVSSALGLTAGDIVRVSNLNGSWGSYTPREAVFMFFATDKRTEDDHTSPVAVVQYGSGALGTVHVNNVTRLRAGHLPDKGGAVTNSVVNNAPRPMGELVQEELDRQANRYESIRDSRSTSFRTLYVGDIPLFGITPYVSNISDNNLATLMDRIAYLLNTYKE